MDLQQLFAAQNAVAAGAGGDEYSDSEELAVAQQCQVCGDCSDSQHFGANVCRACAAFFRRTVAGRLRYACRYEDNCEFSKSSRAMCKSCRLAKCFRVGMDANAVRSRPAVSERRRGGAEKSPPGACRQLSSGSATPNNSEVAFGVAPQLQQGQSPPQLFVAAQPHQFLAGAGAVNNGMFGAFGNVQMQPSAGGGPFLSPHNGNDNLGFAQQKQQLLAQQQQPMAMEDFGSRKVLEQVLLQAKFDFGALPENFSDAKWPILAKIVAGMRRVEVRRSEKYGQPVEGKSVRIFVEKKMLDLHAFWQELHNEIDWVAEMLLHFAGYEQLAIGDQLVLFKHFWILFVILERNYDSHCVLREADEQDNRIVFSNGEIYDMTKCQYDLSRIGHQTAYDVNSCPLKPWFKRSVHEVLPLVRRLRPSPLEMAYCFGIMFWRVPDEISQKISLEARTIARQMSRKLYAELAEFYGTEIGADQLKTVERVAELGRLIGITEILALQRKEETILAKTFQAFKVDIYMDEIFGRNSCE